MTDEFEFEDMESYRGDFGDKISFKLIVLEQLKRIGINSNCEFRGGYWEKVKTIDKDIEKYIPDTRETYSNSIIYLHDLIYPHFQHKQHSKMQTASKNYHIEIEKLLTYYMNDGKFTDSEKLEFRQKKAELCRQLFISLSTFLERVNYFGEKSN